MTREQLLPQKVLEKIPPLYSNEGTPMNEIMIKVKFFIANFTWLIVECEVQDDNDILFYGYTINHADPIFSEWGYFTLNELLKIKLYGSLGIERDLHFKEHPFGELNKEVKK